MKTKSLLFLLLFGFTHLNAQTYYKINFSGEPDSILVENLTKATSLTLQGTDTLSLKLSGVGVQETNRSKRTLVIYPNPMDHSCRFDFENTTQGRVEIQLFNANGKKLHDFNQRLSAGMHQFELSGVPAGVYHLEIKTESYRMSGSFVSTYESSPDIRLIHNKETPFRLANGNSDGGQKLSQEDVPLSFRSIVVMDFSTGDQLKFTGYKTNSDDDVEFASPIGDQTIGFTFCMRPFQPTAIAGNPSPCQGASESYSVTNVSGVTYTWSLPSGWNITSGQNTNSITVTVGTNAGNITVTPSNTCGNGTARTLAVTTQAGPVAPIAGTHVPSQTQIVWNWNLAVGATGYKYNTVNSYATAIDNGTSKTYTQTGLTCNTAYTLYVWAYSSCGNSTILTLTQTTNACTSSCGSPVTFTYNGSTVTYGTVISADNRCWLDRNLGATQVATSSADAASYGHLFQWGRLDDGHQVSTSPTTNTQSNNDVPGHGNFIIGFIGDWRSPQNNNLWQGEGGTNNPCPDGYRLPTQAEWDTERASWSTNNAAGAFASPLKLPVAGRRYYTNGSLSNVGDFGIYWSSTVIGIYSWSLLVHSGGAYMDPFPYRAFGFSVRCLKECDLPVQPSTGVHAPTETHIVWNWNPSEGATGYKYNTANNYATATDNGTSTTWTQTGLTCNTVYTLYVWAYNACGNSTALTLNQTTSACTSGCGSPVTFTYNGSTVTYGSVTSANNKCWLDRNLGATQVATSSVDAASYGHLFQWGRLDDGHQVSTSPTTNTQSNNDVPGHGNFIIGFTDWRSPQNNNLWQGEGGTNNPCPDGYRLPTQAEWDTERASWSTNNAAGAFASPLKLPMAGYRSFFAGSVYDEGSDGYYWSSAVNGTHPWSLYFSSGDANMNGGSRAYGVSVRCLKDCEMAVQPSAGVHVPSETHIAWNWNPSAGATGYKYNTVDNYATATDNGTSTTYSQIELTCNTAYTLYVWAYSSCSNSTVLTLTQTTSACTNGCGSPVTFTYNGSTVTYGTVISANNKCWLDRNLGATQVATSSADAASYGHLFQWGRLDDGHQLRISPTTTTLSNSDVPGHNMFIKAPNYPYDWRSPQNNNLWQGEGGNNNPCPDGYRLPIQAEWDTERASWSTNNAAGAFASPLKLPMAGYRLYFDGSVFGEGSYGAYWSCTVGVAYSWLLYFLSNDAYMLGNGRAIGFSVRCLKD